LTSWRVALPAHAQVYKGRLGPGEMVTAELGSGTFRMHEEICKSVAAAKPYGKWLQVGACLSITVLAKWMGRNRLN